MIPTVLGILSLLQKMNLCRWAPQIIMAPPASNCSSHRKAIPHFLLSLAFLRLLTGLTHAAIQVPSDATGLGYTNLRVASGPWSIHVVQVPRSNMLYEVRSVHAGKGAVGLDTLSDQINLVDSGLGSPVAAINGD